MRSILIGIIVLVGFEMSFAQLSPKDAAVKRRTANKKYKSASKELKGVDKEWKSYEGDWLADQRDIEDRIPKLNRKIDQSVTDIDNAKKTLTSSESVIRDSAGNPIGVKFGGSPKDYNKANAAMTKLSNADKSLDSIHEEATGLSEQLTEMQKDYRVNYRDYSRDREVSAGKVATAKEALDTAKQQEEIAQFENRLRNAEAMQEFEKIKSKVSDQKQKIESLMRIADKTVMGVYVKESVNRLLKSEAFCAAKAACDSKGAQPKQSQVDPIFNFDSWETGFNGGPSDAPQGATN